MKKKLLVVCLSIITTLTACNSNVSESEVSQVESSSTIEDNSSKVSQVESSSTVEDSSSEDSQVSEITHIHKGVFHAEILPTCEKEGNIAYYECECGKKFSDEKCEKELTSYIIPAKNHQYVNHEAKNPTHDEVGNIEYYSCSNCEELFILENGNYVKTTMLAVTLDKLVRVTFDADGGAVIFENNEISYYDISKNSKLADFINDLTVTKDGVLFDKWQYKEAAGVYSDILLDTILTQDITLKAIYKEDLVNKELNNILNEVKATTIVTDYNGVTYFDTKGTYEFEIIGQDYDLLNENDLQLAYKTLSDELLIAIKNNDENAKVSARSKFDGVLLNTYTKFIKTQVHNTQNELNTLFTKGIFKDAGNYINCGVTNYATWITADGTADNRWWTPDMAKTHYILASLDNEVFTSMSDANTKYNNYLVAIAKAMGQKVIEAELFYAYDKNGKPTFNGDPSASEWWFVWNYNGTSGLVYDGPTNYDPSTCNEFRLVNVLYNVTAEGYSGNDLRKTIELINYILTSQIDEMFAYKA